MDRDGYRDELAVAHERIAQLEEQVHELLQAGEAAELPSRVVTLRRERVALVAHQTVMNSGVPTFATFALVAIITGLFALYNGALGLVTMALFGFLALRAFIARGRELRAQRTRLDRLDAEIADAERADMSSTRVRVRLA